MSIYPYTYIPLYFAAEGEQKKGLREGSPLLYINTILHIAGDADLEADGADHVFGVVAIEVLDDESDLALLPLEAEVFGNNDTRHGVVIVGDINFERINERQEVTMINVFEKLGISSEEIEKKKKEN